MDYMHPLLLTVTKRDVQLTAHATAAAGMPFMKWLKKLGLHTLMPPKTGITCLSNTIT